MAVIEAQGVRKVYRRARGGRVSALNGLDLVVDRGGVHGFLGPNGSGKTTTIRALLGLVAVDSGQLRLLGYDVPRALPRALPDVGALVETPLFFPTFSGRRNLRLLARVAGVGGQRVEEVLELVDLRDRAEDNVRGYSLGMKQRLGIAAALLKSPRLLILDEPTNGLDPAGIREVRDVVRRLGSDGRTTVFLSSHLLGEMQQVCDEVSIMSKGRCVASGTVAQILGETGDVRVRVVDPGAGSMVLRRAGYQVEAVNGQYSGMLMVRGVSDPAQLTRVLAVHGLYVTELHKVTGDLETVFLHLTGGHSA
jgi:ABC-2 type transport system ATP-binding protein